MNTAERIVESYFRYCRNCLTIPDVKIPGGNNRQMDLLAVDLTNGLSFHVESTVVPSGRYFVKSRNWRDPYTIFQNKFFAQPKERQNFADIPPENDSEYAKVKQTYRSLGLSADSIRRVWVCWAPEDYGLSQDSFAQYFEDRGITRERTELISFRDTVIPALQRKIGSSNYEDDVLRTFSLLSEFEFQTGVGKVDRDSLVSR